MKIKPILGMTAGLMMSVSTLAQTAAKDSSLLTKNDTLTKTIEYVQKSDTVKKFVPTLYSSGNILRKVPKESIKIFDKACKTNLNDSLNAIDSTLIRNGGINFEKADSLHGEYQYKNNAKSAVTNFVYKKLLQNKDTINIKKLIPDISHSEKRRLQKDSLISKKGIVLPLDSAKTAKINQRMKENNTYDLLDKYTDLNVTPTVKANGNDSLDFYQTVNPNVYTGDFEKFPVKSQIYTDTANQKILAVNAEHKPANCGPIGHKTTDCEWIYSNSCIKDFKPFKKCMDTARTVIYALTGSKPKDISASLKATDNIWEKPAAIQKDTSAANHRAKMILDTVRSNKKPVAIQKDTIIDKLSKPVAKKVVVSKPGQTIWSIAKKDLGKDASNKAVLKRTKEILKYNNMTMEQAKYLKLGKEIKIPPTGTNK